MKISLYIYIYLFPGPDSLCTGKGDGNYPYDNYHAKKENYFVQCSNGNAYCQACFPLSLKFKQECNQCMYNLNGKKK